MLAPGGFSILTPVNAHPEPDVEGERRAQTLRRVLPAAVHRLNNVLLFLQGTCELEVHGPSRQALLARLELVGATLRRLSLLARDPDPGPRPVDLRELFQGVRLLLQPDERGIELRRACSAVFLADERLEERLLDACLALAAGREPGSSSRVRLAARLQGSALRLVLSTDRGPAPEALLGLDRYAEAQGWTRSEHRRGRALAVAYRLPVLPGARSEDTHPPVPAAQSVLLLYEEGEDRELMATVLRESGHQVAARDREPESGTFTLVLVQRARDEAEPGLRSRLAKRYGGARVEPVDARMRPEVLLDLLRARP